MDLSHLSCFHRAVSDRMLLQTLTFLSGQKGRRRPQREELKLTQRFVFGLLFHKWTEQERFHSYTEAASRDILSGKEASVTKHFEGLSLGDLSPAQVLEACHYVYEARLMPSDALGDGTSTELSSHLAAKLPEILAFNGVPLNPADVLAVQNVLHWAGFKGRSFCLDLEDSGIRISGLQTLVGLRNINEYRYRLWPSCHNAAQYQFELKKKKPSPQTVIIQI